MLNNWLIQDFATYEDESGVALLVLWDLASDGFTISVEESSISTGVYANSWTDLTPYDSPEMTLTVVLSCGFTIGISSFFKSLYLGSQSFKAFGKSTHNCIPTTGVFCASSTGISE
ncbi:hypothetical protein WICPIJ_002748 [Wickerhamomyces pijperi]|uniref:Uncharacterized protein n=1 Tax=Wickerhamomyces pijperi TaxID=599730 RepID=A0A9P8TPC1_WICPI|nr:hypothetical protein WICPIJ_002748 [Wickerhamomyces pijperi]